MNGMPKFLSRHFYVVTYAVNLAMIPVFLVCGVTGVLMFPGFLDLLGVSMRRFPIDTVVFLHDWSGLALFAGVLFHLYLHWKPTWIFVRNKVFRLPKRSANDSKNRGAKSAVLEEVRA